MSAEYVEIVHVRLRPGVEDDMLALRPRFLAAMKRAVPGLADARLVCLEDGTWLDLVTWSSQTDSEAALAAHDQIPEAVEMQTYIGEVLGIQQGAVVEAPSLTRPGGLA